MKQRMQYMARLSLITGAVAMSGLFAMGGVAGAAASTSTTTAAQHLQTIISKGDQEISRRLQSLQTVSGKISGATKLTASDKSYLSSEVSTEVSGLTALKTKLDGDTTVADAITDAKSIYSDYRVYALVLPKVWLVKTADDQQVVETKLTDLAQKLQTRLTSEQTAGKDVSSLQTTLNDMTSKVTAAQAISSKIESTVLTLQPSDYNSDHTILSGDNDQLKTARSDNQAAYADAKSIITALKSL